jgi:hypothetical protein
MRPDSSRLGTMTAGMNGKIWIWTERAILAYNADTLAVRTR